MITIPEGVRFLAVLSDKCKEECDRFEQKFSGDIDGLKKRGLMMMVRTDEDYLVIRGHSYTDLSRRPGFFIVEGVRNRTLRPFELPPKFKPGFLFDEIIEIDSIERNKSQRSPHGLMGPFRPEPEMVD